MFAPVQSRVKWSKIQNFIDKSKRNRQRSAAGGLLDTIQQTRKSPAVECKAVKRKENSYSEIDRKNKAPGFIIIFKKNAQAFKICWEGLMLLCDLSKTI